MIHEIKSLFPLENYLVQMDEIRTRLYNAIKLSKYIFNDDELIAIIPYWVDIELQMYRAIQATKPYIIDIAKYLEPFPN